jgi:hypothetical protein
VVQVVVLVVEVEGVIKAVHAIQAANLHLQVYQDLQVAQLHFGRMDVIFVITRGGLVHVPGNSILSITLNQKII